MIDDTISAEEIEEARRRQRIINAYHRVFASEDGKLMLADIKEVFGFDAPIFMRGPSGYDATHAALRDGQRQVVLHIESVLKLEAKGDANVDSPSIEVKTS